MQPRAALRAPADPAFSALDETAVAAASVGTRALPPAIVALSEDPTLLEALTLATIEAAAIVTSPSADRFVDQLMANGAHVALIDAAAAPAPLEEFIAGLRAQFPHLLLLLAGAPPLQHQFRSHIADGTIFRFVHKPASAQRLKLFVETALRRRQSLDEQSAAAAPADGADSGSTRRRIWIAIALLLALSALGIAVSRWLASGAPVQANAAPASLSPVEAASRGTDPAHSAASVVAERDAQILQSKEREAALAAQVQSAASRARAEQAHVYVDLARKRLASGALLAPAEDSARDYVQAALALAPADEEVRAVAVALGEALINAFRQAISAGDAAAAQSWLQACRDYQVGAATLAQLAAQLEQLQGASASP